MKTVRELIQVTTDYLEGKEVTSARLNAERLLADALGLTRIELFMQYDRPVVGKELDIFREFVRRRATGEPLQTILGITEFYSRTFRTETGVFIPRPETEHLVETGVSLLRSDGMNLVSPVAVEVGCGTGIIGISLALEVPGLTVYATDINPLALDLASRNAHALGVETRMNFLPGSRFDPLPERLAGKVELLVSNPPYIKTADIAGLSKEVAEHDPMEALDGGADGLVFYRALASRMGQWVRPRGHVALEIGADQGTDVPEILAASGAEDINVIKDYAGLDRVVVARLGSLEE
jgi:release factor glutamine methyltransferase